MINKTKQRWFRNGAKITLLFLLFCSIASAQEPWHHQLTVDDGLPSNTVYQMIQDSKGYMWMGTENGLTRYDGKEFKTIEHPDLTSYDFNSVHEDSKGNIWSHNFDNQIVQVIGDSVIVYEHKLFMDAGEYLLMDIGLYDALYVKLTNELVRYFPEEDSSSIVFHNDGLSNLSAVNGKVTTGALDHKVYVQYDEIADTLIKYNLDVDRWGIKDYRILAVNGGQIFITNYNSVPEELYVIEGTEPELFDDFRRYKLGDKPSVNDFSILPNGDIWYCMTQGAIRRKDSLILLRGYSVTKVLEDKNGILWASTLKDGIFVFPDLNIKNHTSLDGTQLNFKPASLTFDEKGRLFVGTEYGKIFYWDVENRTIINQYDNKVGKRIANILYNPVTKKLWVRGLQPFNINKPEYKPSIAAITLKDAFLLPENEVLIRRDRVILIHYGADVTKYPKARFSKEWKSIIPNYKTYNLSARELGQPIESIFYEAGKDRIWLALPDKTLLNTREVLRDFFIQDSLTLEASCFAASPDGEVWAGAQGHGFIILKEDKLWIDKRGEQFKSFGEIRRIAQGDQMWLLTANALLVTDYKGELLYVYDELQGVISNNVTDIDVLGKTAWLTTKNGLMEINFQESKKQLPPPLIIQGVYAGDKRVKKDTTYQLEYNQNTVRIDFRALAVNPKSNFTYQYRMKGLDKNWQIAGPETESVRYPALTPDKYQFEIKTLSRDKLSSAAHRIKFHVQPPFWRRAWFILGSVLLLGGVLYYIYASRLKRIQKENDYEQQLRSSQLTALRTQMNPHFIFNALNSIQEFIILNEKRLANEYLGKFARLMRIYLSHSNRDWIPLREEIDALKLYLELEQLRFEDTEIILDINPKLIGEDVFIPPLFVQPYVENAFKHGLLHRKKDRKLYIHFQKNEHNALEIIIEDNGVGRAKTMELKKSRIGQNTSFSTTANQKRLELLNYNASSPVLVDIIDLHTDGIATGTKVLIHIPINPTN